MPAFAALVSSFFGALTVFLAKMFAAKLAIRLLGIGAITAIGISFMATFNNFIAPLVMQLFSTQYGQFLGLAFPPISGTVITGITTLWIACNTYLLQVRAVRLTASI